VDPLSVCYAGQGQSGLIVGFASTPEERIRDAVAKLVAVLRRELDLSSSHGLALLASRHTP
jgi:hypothetical protein